MPRGGVRAGSGRKPGSKDSRPRVPGEHRARKQRLVIKVIALLKKQIKEIEKHSSREKQAKKVFVCQQCGREFTSGIKQGPKKNCSVECRRLAKQALENARDRWKEKTCECCGETYRTQNGNTSKYCSLACAGKVFSERGRRIRPIYHCRKCGKEFYRGSRPTDSLVYCSRKCAGSGEIGNAKTPHNPRGGNHYKRTKFYGVLHESINVTAVFERDGYRCQICGKATPKKNRGTLYSNAPELDHRTPLSMGGGHLYVNVQCACRKCNHDKSNKNEAGQLPLFEIRRVA